MAIRARRRFGFMSLATSVPQLSMSAAIWVVFPPGAAQRSRIRSPGLGSRAKAGRVWVASWT